MLELIDKNSWLLSLYFKEETKKKQIDSINCLFFVIVI